MSSIPPTYDRGYFAGSASEPFAHPEYFEGVPWRRVAAYLCDLVVICLIALVLAIPFLILTFASLFLLAPVLWPCLLLIPVLYSALTIGGARSATFGMRLFDLEVRAWTGERPGYLQAGLKTVLFYLTTGVTFFLALAVALFNERHRTLHDFLAGTIVVRRAPPPVLVVRN